MRTGHTLKMREELKSVSSLISIPPPSLVSSDHLPYNYPRQVCYTTPVCGLPRDFFGGTWDFELRFLVEIFLAGPEIFWLRFFMLRFLVEIFSWDFLVEIFSWDFCCWGLFDRSESWTILSEDLNFVLFNSTLPFWVNGVVLLNSLPTQRSPSTNECMQQPLECTRIPSPHQLHRAFQTSQIMCGVQYLCRGNTRKPFDFA